jgi:uncharacterized repeat protein (TIGR01451 family)
MATLRNPRGFRLPVFFLCALILALVSESSSKIGAIDAVQQTFVWPTTDTVTQNFRPPNDPTHNGVDIQSTYNRPQPLSNPYDPNNPSAEDLRCLAEPGSVDNQGQPMTRGDYNPNDGLNQCDDWKGAVVWAASSGIVTFAGYDSINGTHMIRIDHGNLANGDNVVTEYLHLGTKVRDGRTPYDFGGQRSFITIKDACVKTGDPIGFQGYSGRTQATHLHYQVKVGGVYVDPAEWRDRQVELTPPSLSSLCGPRVYFYDLPNFNEAGNRWAPLGVGGGIHNISAPFAKSFSSVWMSSGLTVTVYEEPDGKGGYKTFYASDRDFSDDFFDNKPGLSVDNQISSYAVFNGCPTSARNDKVAFANFCPDSTPTPAPPPPPQPSDGVELVSVSSHIVQPGEKFRPAVTVRVQSGELHEDRGDLLRCNDPNCATDAAVRFNAWPHVAVAGNVGTGQTHTFTFYENDPMIAPSTPGTYISNWRVWRAGQWAGPNIPIAFSVGSSYSGPEPPSYTPSFAGQTVSWNGNSFRSDDGKTWIFQGSDAERAAAAAAFHARQDAETQAKAVDAGVHLLYANLDDYYVERPYYEADTSLHDARTLKIVGPWRGTVYGDRRWTGEVIGVYEGPGLYTLPDKYIASVKAELILPPEPEPLPNISVPDTTPPPAPELLEPANGAALTDTTPTFSWTEVTDPSGINYELEIGYASDFPLLLILDAVVPVNRFTLPDGQRFGQGAYAWRVKPVDGAGNQGTSSSIRAFTIRAVTTPQLAGKIVSDNNGDIYIMNADGSDRVNLTQNGKGNAKPTLSPDGSKVAFACNGDICIMNLDGSQVTKLSTTHTSNAGAVDTFPDWSPDGTRIVFVSSRDGAYRLYVMNSDGSSQSRISPDQFIDVSSAAWSPDGAKITFSDSLSGHLQVYTMNPDGSGAFRVTATNTTDDLPRWSPDGGRIVFHSYRDGPIHIYTINADGTGETRLTNGIGSDYSPTFSPDGSAIAFASSRDGEEVLYVMNVDGSAQTGLNAPGRDPSWRMAPPPPVPTPTPVPTSTPTPTPVPSTPPCTAPSGQYCAEYYNNTNLSGSPILTENEPAPIAHDWSYQSPKPGIGDGNYSVRWQGRFSIEAGDYKFIARSDDGIRVWLDGTQLPEISDWTDHGSIDYEATRTLTAGEHEIKLEYYQAGGAAVIQFGAFPVQQADLSLSKVVDNPTPSEGGTVKYTLTVTNNGPDGATGVQVTDLLPPALSFLSAVASQGNYDNGTGVWSVGAITSGSSATLELSVAINIGSSGTITNSSEITASDQDDPDSTPNNNVPSEDDQANVNIDVQVPEQLVTDIVVSNGKTYLLDSLNVGKKLYIDRAFTFTNVPSQYVGHDLIVTANNDKNAIKSNFLRFNLTNNATVSVLFDNRVTTLPAWLNDGTWALAGDIIGTSDTRRRVYQKGFGAGPVQLGGNAMAPMKGAGSNYNVVASAN